jgi:hypothetical protein
MILNNGTPQDILVKPKLVLLVFHLCRELTQENLADAESIWSKLAGVGSLLNIPQLEQLPQLIAASQENQRDYNSFSLQEKIVELLPNPVLNFAHPATDTLPPLQGGIYPIRMHDTYGVDLTIEYLSDLLVIDHLSQINPQGCLLPGYIQPSLGQTILLCDRRIAPIEDPETLAGNCVKAISTSEAKSSLPKLIGKGTLLGGAIYQFADDLLDPTQRKNFLVWLLTGAETLELETKGDYYHPLLNLLCSRHKIQFCYFQARQSYKQARKLYGEIEPVINNFSQLKIQQDQWLQTELSTMKAQTSDRHLKQQIELLLNYPEAELSNYPSPSLKDRIEQYLQEVSNQRIEEKLRQSQQQRLQMLETWLIEIPQKSVNYARCLRNLQTNITTIAINAQNYEFQLNRLKIVSLPQDDLSYLETFLHQDCSQYQQQIGFNLDYLTSGKDLFDRTIDSIRGLVEIDAQKQQLIEDLAEEERDRRIELWLTVVGSGLAVSALTSTIMPEPIQPLLNNYQVKYEQTWYGNQASLLAMNVLFHSMIGILSAMLVAVVFRGAIDGFIRFLSDRIRQR